MSRKEPEPFVPAKLPKALVREIAKIAAEYGAAAFEERYEKYKLEQKDRKLRNTKLLLRNYRSLKEYSTSAIYDVAQLAVDGMDTIMELIGCKKEGKVESIEDSVIKTKLIMEHVDTMLQGYKARCYASNKGEVKRRWRVLNSLYLSSSPTDPQEICEREHISNSTVYEDINSAATELSTLFFGIDCLELWK